MPQIGLATTEAEREAVYRFRYEVYVEEMGRYRGVADHERRLFSEPVDAQSRIFYAADGDRVVATSRLTWPGDGPLPERQVEQYQLQPFLEVLEPQLVAVGERAMVAPDHRGSDLFLRLMEAGMEFVNAERIQVLFGACEPHLLPLYQSLGQRTYSRRNINSPEAGYLIPLLLVVEDVEYFRRLRSPLAEIVRDFGSDARVPAELDQLLVGGSSVLSRKLVAGDAYWREVHDALEEVAGQRFSALDGMADDEAARCLERSTIIECSPGDRVVKKGGISRNLYVVLDGTLEVRDDDRVLAALGPGDVFGEMSFLLERPRSMDVCAVGGETRVLCLSESVLRGMIEDDPRVAAALLLNVSKMLCLRLLKMS